MAPTPVPKRAGRARVPIAAGVAIALVSGLLASLGATTAAADPPPSPGPLAEGDVIYQVLVDRF